MHARRLSLELMSVLIRLLRIVSDKHAVDRTIPAIRHESIVRLAKLIHDLDELTDLRVPDLHIAVSLSAA